MLRSGRQVFPVCHGSLWPLTLRGSGKMETAMPAKHNPVVFVHGYSDKGASWAAWREILRGRLALDNADLRTCTYVSLNNEVTVKDLAEAFDRALATQGGLDADQPFDAMVHSTGMLVVRSWLAYASRLCRRSRPRRRTPI